MFCRSSLAPTWKEYKLFRAFQKTCLGQPQSETIPVVEAMTKLHMIIPWQKSVTLASVTKKDPIPHVSHNYETLQEAVTEGQLSAEQTLGEVQRTQSKDGWSCQQQPLPDTQNLICGTHYVCSEKCREQKIQPGTQEEKDNELYWKRRKEIAWDFYTTHWIQGVGTTWQSFRECRVTLLELGKCSSRSGLSCGRWSVYCTTRFGSWGSLDNSSVGTPAVQWNNLSAITKHSAYTESERNLV